MSTKRPRDEKGKFISKEETKKEKDENIFVPPEDVVRLYNEILASPNAEEILKKAGNPKIDVTANALKPTNKTKVAIVGFASNWQDAPWDDKDCEIWGLNELYMYFEKMPKKARADRWFEIHSRHSPTKGTPEHQGWLKKCPIPVYMHEHYDDIPNSVKYPVDEILDFVYKKGLKLDFPDGTEMKNRYGTNSISWMFLLAWYLGFKEISIYGVDLAQNEEYYYQRPNLEYYIGAAQREGIKVIMPPTCDLMKAFSLYGFETDNPLILKMKKRLNDLKKQKQKKEINRNKAQAVANQENTQIVALDGHIQELTFQIKNWRI